MSRWPSVALGDIFEIARGSSPRPIDKFITDDPDGINWIMIGDASQGSKYITSTKKKITKAGAQRSRKVHAGDFLLTNSMSFGHPYILRTSGCIHDGWLVLSSHRDDVDPDYFYYLLGSGRVYSEFERRAAGATVKNLNIDLVRGVEVALPPLAEQRRIATILDQADQLRQTRKLALGRLDELTRAIFVEMFGEPITNPRKLPTAPLKELGQVSTGSTPPGEQDGMFGGDIPFVTPGDLGSGDPIRRTVTQEGAAAARTVRSGATLVCCIGATIGKMDWARAASAFNQQINAVEWLSRINDDYGFQALTFFKQKIAAWGASTTLPILKKSTFETIEIPVPALSDQRDFSACVAKVYRIKSAQRSHLAYLNDMFGSLQGRAFRGEL